MPKRKTTEEFIIAAKAVHGDKYGYGKVGYINSDTEVCIICPEHGEFWQKPIKHINAGQGCPKCAGRGHTTEDFIKEARAVHGEKYDYSKTVLKHKKKKVIIVCPEHGEFLQTPNNHLQGAGCPKCGKTEKLTTEEFIRRAHEVHGDKYDYSKVEYKNIRDKVKLICPEHGEFWQEPMHHLNGHGCPKCGGTAKLTTEEFIKKAKSVHGEKYDYFLVDYENALEQVDIICPIHGIFRQMPASHLSGNGCPSCRESKLEKTVSKILEGEGVKFEREKTFDWLINPTTKHHMFLDFYLPDFKMAIECQGEQHFHKCGFFDDNGIFEERYERDKMKNKLCNENNIRVLYFAEEKPYTKKYFKEVITDVVKLVEEIEIRRE